MENSSAVDEAAVCEVSGAKIDLRELVTGSWNLTGAFNCVHLAFIQVIKAVNTSYLEFNADKAELHRRIVALETNQFPQASKGKGVSADSLKNVPPQLIAKGDAPTHGESPRAASVQDVKTRSILKQPRTAVSSSITPELEARLQDIQEQMSASLKVEVVEMQVLLRESQRRLDVVQESIAGMVQKTLSSEIQGFEKALQFDTNEIRDSLQKQLEAMQVRSNDLNLGMEQQFKRTKSLQQDVERQLKVFQADWQQDQRQLKQVTSAVADLKEAHQEQQLRAVKDNALVLDLEQQLRAVQDSAKEIQRDLQEFKMQEPAMSKEAGTGNASNVNPVSLGLDQRLRRVQTDLQGTHQKLEEQQQLLVRMLQKDSTQFQLNLEQQLQDVQKEQEGLAEQLRTLQAGQPDLKEIQRKANEAHLLATTALGRNRAAPNAAEPTEEIDAASAAAFMANDDDSLPIKTPSTPSMPTVPENQSEEAISNEGVTPILKNSSPRNLNEVPVSSRSFNSEGKVSPRKSLSQMVMGSRSSRKSKSDSNLDAGGVVDSMELLRQDSGPATPTYDSRPWSERHKQGKQGATSPKSSASEPSAESRSPQARSNSPKKTLTERVRSAAKLGGLMRKRENPSSN